MFCRHNINFVIINYNSSQDCIECIDKILGFKIQNSKIFIVDNASSIYNVELLSKAISLKEESCIYLSKEELVDFYNGSKKIHLVLNQFNDGFAKSNNLIIKVIEKEQSIVVLINPDMVLDDTFANFIEYLNRTEFDEIIDKVIGIPTYSYQSKQKLNIGAWKLNTLFGRVKPVQSFDEIERANYINGGLLITTTNTFEKFGLLPEEYFLYWEEADWCYNFKKRGGRLTVFEHSIGYDKGGTSTGGRGEISIYYYTRNALIFASKYYPTSVPIIKLKIMLQIIKSWLKSDNTKRKALLKGLLDYKNRR